MKLRSSLVCLIIVAQLGWLGYHYHFRTEELRTAPHISVKCSLPTYGVKFRYNEVYHLTDSPIFGKSLWWNAEKWYKEAITREKSQEKVNPEIQLVSRPAPGDEVQGALELVPKGYHEGTELVAIWSKGEDGFWTFRLEAPGSSEATPREGELCTRAMLWKHRTICSNPADQQEEKTYSASLTIHPFIHPTHKTSSFHRYDPNLHFYMNDDDQRGLREWIRTATQEQRAQISCSLEIALRKNSPPMAVQAYVFGHPIHEAILLMKEGKLPLPEAPKSDDSHPQKSEPNSPSNEATKEILNLAETLD